VDSFWLGSGLFSQTTFGWLIEIVCKAFLEMLKQKDLDAKNREAKANRKFEKHILSLLQHEGQFPADEALSQARMTESSSKKGLSRVTP